MEAPSRASTLINYTSYTHDSINCVFEIDESYRIGHSISGTIILMRSEKFLLKKNQII